MLLGSTVVALAAYKCLDSVWPASSSAEARGVLPFSLNQTAASSVSFAFHAPHVNYWSSSNASWLPSNAPWLSRKRQKSSSFVANNNTPSSVAVKMIAAYLCVSDKPGITNNPATERRVDTIWLNPSCGDQSERDIIDGHRCDISAGPIKDPRPAYDGKLMRYKNNVPVPGNYKVINDFIRIAGPPNEIGIELGRQTARVLSPNVAFNFLRLEFCKQNAGNAKNVRVEGPGLDSPLEFTTKNCVIHSRPIQGGLTLKPNSEVVVAVSYDVRESLYDKDDPPPGIEARETACLGNRCFRMPTFLPFVYDSKADVVIGDIVYEDLNADGKFSMEMDKLVPKVKIELWAGQRSSALKVAETESASDGKWSFSRYEAVFENRAVVLEPDSVVFLEPNKAYSLRFIPPLGFQPTRAITADSKTSNFGGFLDAKRDAGVRLFNSPNAGDSNNDLDMGFVKQFSVGTRVWLDENRDGVRSADDMGIGNVTLQLLTQDAKTVLYQTVTDDDGIYNIASLPGGMFPKTTYILQLDLSQPSLRDFIEGESLTSTIFQVRGTTTVEDDNDGKLVGSAMHATFESPNFFAELKGIDFGLRSFDCGPLASCSGHGNCVTDKPPTCGCQPGWTGQNCDTATSLPPTPIPATDEPQATTDPFAPVRYPCDEINGRKLYVDNCGLCGGNNECEMFVPGQSSSFGGGGGGGDRRGGDPVAPIAVGIGICVFCVCVTVFVILLRRRAKKAQQESKTTQMAQLDGGSDNKNDIAIPDYVGGSHNPNLVMPQMGNYQQSPVANPNLQYQDGGAVHPHHGGVYGAAPVAAMDNFNSAVYDNSQLQMGEVATYDETQLQGGMQGGFDGDGVATNYATESFAPTGAHAYATQPQPYAMGGTMDIGGTMNFGDANYGGPQEYTFEDVEIKPIF